MTDAADDKQTGKSKVKEGKSKMTPRLCEELGHFFHEEDMQEAQFNNGYSWNLMCRHFNVDNLHASHFGYAVDAFVIEYGKTKNQPSGGGLNMTSMLKHLYANPFKPHVSTFTPTFTPPFISATFTPTFTSHVRSVPLHLSVYSLPTRRYMVNVKMERFFAGPILKTSWTRC